MAKGPLTVLAYGQDDKTELDEGKLDLIDNQIVQTTGTIRLRASFPNARHTLWPGELVNARLLLETRHDGLTVAAVGRAARAERLVRLGDRRRRERSQCAASGRSDQRGPGARSIRACRPTRRSWSTASTGCSPARWCRSCRARRRKQPTCRARSSRPSHEHLRALHPPADRDGAPDGRPAAGRAGDLSAAARGGAAQRQLSDDPGDGAAAGRGPADHGLLGRDAARAAVLADPRRHPADLDRARSASPSSRVQFDLSRAIDGAATDVLVGDQRGERRICRMAFPTRRPSAR